VTLETTVLRATIRAGAATIPGARISPDGLGFHVRSLEFGFDYRNSQWVVWEETGGPHGRGATPAEAMANRRIREGEW
jgi:hypothetical protein